MFEDLDQQLNGEEPKDKLKKTGVNEFIISHNKDFSVKNEEAQNKNNPAKKDKLGKRVDALELKGKKRGKRYSIIGILGAILIAIVVIIVGYFILSQTKKISLQVDRNIDNIPDIREEMENKIILRNSWLKCEKDNDCIETKKDCCDCYNGGEQTAMNRKYFDDWYELLNNNCADIDCSAFENCEEGRVKCNNNICEFVSSDEEEIEDKDYYDFLEDKCLGDLCCFSSVENMRENNYLECAKNNKCPEGFQCVFNDCEVSLGWCEIFREDAKTEISIDLSILDSDEDGLSDEEEIFYGTDKNNPDTDGDGYLDGDEVEGGYNPQGEGKL